MGTRRREVWIRRYRDFGTHEKTVVLAEALTRLGVPLRYAHLVVDDQWSRLVFHLWDQQAPQGRLGRMTPLALARIVGWPDLDSAQALWDAWMDSGFVDEPGTPQARLHDFDEAFEDVRRLQSDAIRKRLVRSEKAWLESGHPPTEASGGSSKAEESTGRDPPLSSDMSADTSLDARPETPVLSADCMRARARGVSDSGVTGTSRISSSQTQTLTQGLPQSRARGAEPEFESEPDAKTKEDVEALWHELMPDCPRVEWAKWMPAAIEREIAKGRNWRNTFAAIRRVPWLWRGTTMTAPVLGFVLNRLAKIDSGEWENERPRAQHSFAQHATARAQQTILEGLLQPPKNGKGS